MKQLFIATILLIIFGATNAQDFEIKMHLPEAANKKVTLVHYYNSQFAADDTLTLDDSGKGTFARDTALHQGLYKLFVSGKQNFDFLLGEDQTFSIESEKFSIDDLKIKGAKETEEFAKYMVFLRDMNKQSKELRNKAKDASEEEKKELSKKMNELTSELQDYWFAMDKKYPGTFLAKFLMTNYTTPIPDDKDIPAEIVANDSMLLRYKFDFQKKHYFDHFDLTDERLFYTPLVKPKIEKYYDKIILHTFDSMYTACLELIETVKPNKPMFQYVTSYLLNKSVNSKIMGMDALFVEIAKRYYISGEAFWANEKTMESIRENLLFAKNNLIGMIAPELQLESINEEEYFSLHQIDAKVTLLLIYEPNCSHCKVFVPELHKKIYSKYKDKGFEVYAIYSMDNKEEWEEFVEKHDLYDWINVWDEKHLSNFKITYDARKTPGIYLLDENKEIIAKKLTIEQVESYLEKLLD